MRWTFAALCIGLTFGFIAGLMAGLKRQIALENQGEAADFDAGIFGPSLPKIV